MKHIVALCMLAALVSAQEMPMPEWMKPTQEHKDLAKSAGHWKAVVKFDMGGQTMTSEGMAIAKMIFGGRILKQKYLGDMMGTHFTGTLYVGYDTVDKKHFSIWMDSMSPIVSVATGAAKEGVTRLESLDPDWMTGQKSPAATEIKWINDDEYVLTMIKVVDGKDVRVGEIRYTRLPQTLPPMMANAPHLQAAPEHAQLAKFTGAWDSAMEFMPGASEKGITIGKLVSGGKILEQHYHGSFMGSSFRGKWTLAYDSIDKQWVATWTDNFSPFISISKGKSIEGGGIRFEGLQPSMNNPGTKEKSISVVRWLDDNTWELAFFMEVNGKEVPAGKITYKRRKS